VIDLTGFRAANLSGLFVKQYNHFMSDFHFYHPIEVRYGDLDPQGHVNNAKYLTCFEQARIAYWIQLGLFTKDQSFMEIGVILADVHITYLEPIYYGQNIKVGVHVAKLGNKSMTWEQNIVDAETGKELARGEVIVVAYNYEEKKTIPIPGDWRDKIVKFEGLEQEKDAA
jgi:acyl-CoA thioester hydrolase